MKPSLTKEALKVALKAKRPVYLEGPPGVGKSQIVAQVARELGLEFQDFRAVTCDPVDLKGMPKVEGNLTLWTLPGFLPQAGKGVLFIDELVQAPQLVQNALSQLVLDRRIGDYIFPEGWLIVAAGNRDGDKAATTRMPSHLANRFVHIKFDVDIQDWTTWALSHDIRAEIIGFIRWRPALLFQFDPKRNDKAFATPRTWEFLSQLLDQAPPKSIEFELCSGCVGEGPATEFLGFLRIYRDLPDPEKVIQAPENGIVPEDPAILYALCGALARKATAGNIDKIILYSYRLPAEFSVMMIADAARLTPAIVKTKAFVEWSVKNQDVLI
jgi:DNA polymerase III delta prime subunit